MNDYSEGTPGPSIRPAARHLRARHQVQRADGIRMMVSNGSPADAEAMARQVAYLWMAEGHECRAGRPAPRRHWMRWHELEPVLPPA